MSMCDGKCFMPGKPQFTEFKRQSQLIGRWNTSWRKRQFRDWPCTVRARVIDPDDSLKGEAWWCLEDIANVFEVEVPHVDPDDCEEFHNNDNTWVSADYALALPFFQGVYSELLTWNFRSLAEEADERARASGYTF